MPSVFAHIVLWNSATIHGYETIHKAVQALTEQVNFTAGVNLSLLVSDNASCDQVYEKLAAKFSGNWAKFQRFDYNFGFSGAHNIGAYEFLHSKADYLLVLNPDCRLDSDCLNQLCRGLSENSQCQLATPRLLRANLDMQSLEPAVLDACGMQLTNALRHFDRGSGELAANNYLLPEEVFGGTGACLLLSRSAVERLALPILKYSTDQERVHPQLKHLPPTRVDLFDEAFFAYREDADLAWRANNLGVKCLYVPTALAYHRRVVTPERRSDTDPSLNRHSVRNRFLLQINNYYFRKFPQGFLPGIICRNLIVILGVLIKEHSSLPGLWDIFKLWRRARERRRAIESV